MKLKNIISILTITLLCSACSSKDEFNKGMYNYLQDSSFCSNSQECKNKRLHPNDYKKNEKLTYDEYKKSISN